MAAKQIKFTIDGTDYTLEYTRNTVKQMEQNGFRVDDIGTKPMTMLPALFAGAFLAHHRFVKQDRIDYIFSQLSEKDKLLEKLAEMYNEPISAMLDESEGNEGNAKWTVG